MPGAPAVPGTVTLHGHRDADPRRVGSDAPGARGTTRTAAAVRDDPSGVGAVEAERSERTLAERAAQGDAEAWAAIYRRAYPRLMDYALRRLPGRAAADDAVSETMARAIARIDRFTWQGSGIDAWLYGILRNVVLEAYRGTGRAGGELPADMASLDDDPVDAVLLGEEAACVRRAFLRLASDDREVLELRVVAGLDAQEVGAVVGKRPGAVRTAQSRALTRLRSLLEGAAP